jgi:predicted transcriptional regulator
LERNNNLRQYTITYCHVFLHLVRQHFCFHALIALFLRNWIRGERTVKSLRLSKALTVPETTTVYEACRRMAARRVDALLLTDSNALLCGILTDKV